MMVHKIMKRDVIISSPPKMPSTKSFHVILSFDKFASFCGNAKFWESSLEYEDALREMQLTPTTAVAMISVLFILVLLSLDCFVY